MAGPATGERSIWGCAVESTYGTPVTPDRFLEFLPGETMERRQRTITSQGIRGGTINLPQASREVMVGRDGGGDVSFEVATTGFGRLLLHALGGTPTYTQQGVTTAYLHTYPLGDTTGKMLTVQKQLVAADGTVISPFTFHGVKILDVEWSIDVNGFLIMKLTTDAEDVERTTAAATASYSTTKLFRFDQGAVTLDAVAIASVSNARVALTRPLKTDRDYLGSNQLKKEPVANGKPNVDGQFQAEFLSAADFYAAYENYTSVALVLEFVGDTIASTFKETFRITVPVIKFQGETPKVSGTEVINASPSFVGRASGSTAGITVEYMTTDTTA